MDVLNDLLQNPAAAALIAAALTFLAGIVVNSLNQRSLAKKEERQWNWNKQFEEEKQAREEKKLALQAQEAENERIRNMYNNSIRILATLGNEEVNLVEEEKLRLVTEANEWLTLLALYLVADGNTDSERFNNRLSWFSRQPRSDAHDLRDLVIEIALQDTSLFPEAKPKSKPNPNEISVQIELDGEFRKQQFIGGNTLPKHNHVAIDLLKLTPSQRQLLLEVYSRIPPKNLVLELPVYDEAQSKLVLRGKHWSVEFDPLLVTPEEVINRWEVAYNEALTEAEAKQNEGL